MSPLQGNRRFLTRVFLFPANQTWVWLGTFLLLAMVSCAVPQKKTQVSPVKPPAATTRVFAGFAAVVVQPRDTLASLAETYLHDPSRGWLIGEFNNISALRPGQTIIIPSKPYNKGGLSLNGYQTVPVLCYHKFSKNISDKMTVREEDFEEQMRFLGNHGYHVISLDQLFGFLSFKEQIPKKSVVITIDDGWRSTYDVAYPILKRFGYPATLFVYTNLITGSSKTLSWDLIKVMYANGIDMQCHTKTHRSLHWKREEESFRQYFDAVQVELTESATILKEQLNKDIHYLAYPYGDTNHLVIEVLKKQGIRAAFTVKRGTNPFFSNHYRLDRSMVYGDFTLTEFEKNLQVFASFK
jgi:peptidoglycan/xylan/chitin deacetylase (PgdA/CDA1 family)